MLITTSIKELDGKQGWIKRISETVYKFEPDDGTPPTLIVIGTCVIQLGRKFVRVVLQEKH